MSDVSVSRPGSAAAAGPQEGPPETATVTVRYFAAARAAAGADEEAVTIPPSATVSTVIDAITARHGEALARVLTRCSYLLDAVAVRDLSTAVGRGAQLDVLPPFAGG